MVSNLFAITPRVSPDLTVTVCGPSSTDSTGSIPILDKHSSVFCSNSGNSRGSHPGISRVGRVVVERFSGKRYDCGSKLGYLKAQIVSGLIDPNIRKSIKEEITYILKQG